MCYKQQVVIKKIFTIYTHFFMDYVYVMSQFRFLIVTEKVQLHLS